MSDKKIREFYIDHSEWYSKEEVEFNESTLTKAQFNKDNLVHVVEYRALRQAQEKIAKLELDNEALQNRLNISVGSAKISINEFINENKEKAEKIQQLESRIDKLKSSLTCGSYNSIRETLALMSEGEGDNAEVYRTMANSALIKLDQAIADDEKGE